MAGIKLDLSNISRGVTLHVARIDARIDEYSKSVALDVQNFARLNAPWINRTGDARKHLTAKAERLGPLKYEVTLSHGVDYGKWLELAHEKKYAIIMPTIRNRGPKIMEGLKILSK